MKKAISILLSVIVMTMALSGCNSKENRLLGTWEATYVEIDGTKYTKSELEAKGDYSISDSVIIIQRGGKAYVTDGSAKGTVDWSVTDNGVKIGKSDCKIVDSKICVEYSNKKVYFEKRSDNEVFPDESSENLNSEVADLDVTSSNNTKSDNTKTDSTVSNLESTNSETEDSGTEEEMSVPSVAVKESPDKYTWYIKSYVGMNCASLGYTSLGGDRLDSYGYAHLRLIFITNDGTYVDIDSEDDLKQYVVTGQNIEPNSELKLTFRKGSDGKELDALVSSQTYEEILLSVKKVHSSEKEIPKLTSIKPSPDKYTRYIADYTGRNLANCGYTSIAGGRMQKYGEAIVKLVIVSDDGTYIDPSDTESLKGYVVTEQNVAANSELNIVFLKNDEGKEYDNLVDTQNIKEIELKVKPVSG